MTADRCPHGLTAAHRDDGRPACALCRRDQTTADPAPLAPVIPLRTA